MSPITSSLLVFFAVLCASAFADNVATGYVTRVDFTDVGCVTAFRNTTFLVNACAPPSPSMVTYDNSSNSVTVQYFNGDKTCTNVGSTATYTEGDCNASPITPYIFYYSEVFPELMDGVYTYTTFNPSKTDCSGEVYSVEQELPICFPNSYQTYNSTILTCQGTTLTTLSCTDNDCQTACATVTTSADPTKCDTPNHAVSSCNPPATTSGGATVATTGKSTASATSTGKTTSAGSTTDSTTGGSANTGAGSAETTHSSSSATIAASVVLASVSAFLLL